MTDPAGIGNAIADAYRKLDGRDRIVLLTTTVAFLLGFLPWHAIVVFDVTTATTSGFGTWNGKLFFLTCLATVCFLLSPALRQQLLGRLSRDARALTIPILSVASLILGPVFSLLDSREAYAGIRDAAEDSEGLVAAGSTLWYALALIACVASAGFAVAKWRALRTVRSG